VKWLCTIVRAAAGRVFVQHFTLTELPTIDCNGYVSFIEAHARECVCFEDVRTMELRPAAKDA